MKAPSRSHWDIGTEEMSPYVGWRRIAAAAGRKDKDHLIRCSNSVGTPVWSLCVLDP